MTRWVEEILHHLGWLKPYQSWDKRINHLSTGAGFLPSTVVEVMLASPNPQILVDGPFLRLEVGTAFRKIRN
jgi:hypothetical protein